MSSGNEIIEEKDSECFESFASNVGNLGIVEEEKDEESKLDNLTVISPLFRFRGMFAYWAWFHAQRLEFGFALWLRRSEPFINNGSINDEEEPNVGTGSARSGDGSEEIYDATRPTTCEIREAIEDEDSVPDLVDDSETDDSETDDD